MIKLTASYDQSTAWYFCDMTECEKFKSVFTKSNLEIIWDEPIEKVYFSEMEDDDWNETHEKPKSRAEKALFWGYSVTVRQRIDSILNSTEGIRLSDEQKIIFKLLINNL